MDSVIVSTELLSDEKIRYNTFKDEKKLDMWLEIKRRWLIFGVLLSILLAVVSPRVGSPGGPLYPEYLSLGPLWYIYYSAGRSARSWSFGGLKRACVLAVVHAHVVSPVICALVASAAGSAGLHNTLVKGALLSSAGGGCAWLSLGVTVGVAPGHSARAAILLAAIYLASVPAAPLTLYLICGRAPIPAVGPSIWSALCVIPPFVGGFLYTHSQSQRTRNMNDCADCTQSVRDCPHCVKASIQCVTGCTQSVSDCTQSVSDCTQCIRYCTQCVRDCTYTTQQRMLWVRLCVLLLVYFDCCERLREAEGSLHLSDVLGTMVLAVGCVSCSAGCCVMYARCLPPSATAALLVCAVPKALHAGWLVSSSCVPWGLSRLPAVFAAPTQALLLAAILA